MSNILNHNRLPLECKLSYKDYWDFCLRIGREYYDFPTGLQTQCLSAFIDTTFDECLNDDNSLVSTGDYVYDTCTSKDVVLQNFGLTGMDNGYILFDKDNITEEEFEALLETERVLPEGDCRLHVFPVGGNNGRYTYSNEIVNLNDVRVSKLNGGFYQGFFRIGNGCEYSVLPSDIGNGLSLEFELCRKDFESEGYTLNDASGGKNKGIFFYIGTRAENKWIRYYYDSCSENDTKTESTELETSDGIQLNDYVPELTETDNKFLIYSRTCGGTTVLNDTGEETVLLESNPVVYDDNLFTIFSRKCGGITVNNFEEDYLREHPTNKYNIYADLWSNALAFQITDDNRVGYKYLIKNCESENPACSYKIVSEYSKVDNVPYGEWTTIHVRILPCGTNNMKLLFYVNGRLVLYSKELPKLNLRELKDLSSKQEGVPFNISIGGGTQGLSDVVYEDYTTYHETNYPLQNEFGGSFIGYLKAFKFYSCSLNYNQILQNFYKTKIMENVPKIYCGAIVFNTKPSKTQITEQSDLIQMLNEYNIEVEHISLRLLPNIAKRYIRIVVAAPIAYSRYLAKAVDTMKGLDNEAVSGQECEITQFFNIERVMINNQLYNVWYYTYGTRPQYNNTIEIEIG